MTLPRTRRDRSNSIDVSCHRPAIFLPTLALVLLLWVVAAPACELCAIYNAANPLGESNDGFLFAVSEFYVPYATSQFNGQVVKVINPS